MERELPILTVKDILEYDVLCCEARLHGTDPGGKKVGKYRRFPPILSEQKSSSSRYQSDYRGKRLS